jgi:hypothetical protein
MRLFELSGSRPSDGLRLGLDKYRSMDVTRIKGGL